MRTAIRFIMISAALISFCCAFSQSFDNNWVFGDSAGINFSSGEPVFFKTGIHEETEACASISDQNGNLLFYTNGHSVWDKNNNIMPHGDSLEIGYFTPEYGSSMTQGVIIAPAPGNDSLFYILYLWNNIMGGNINLKYAVLNLHLNGGLGDITEKNILLASEPLTEKLQLVKHANGRDWWLIALTKADEEGDIIKFVKFLITPLGLNGPFYQDYADVYHTGDGGALQPQQVGYMKFSQAGSKACISKGTDVDIYDFDRCSGMFSNYINIDTVVATSPTDRYVYGIEFSSSERYIYVTSVDGTVNSTQTFLYQFCLSCIEPEADSKTLIYASDLGMSLFALLLSSNEKIYMTSYSLINTETHSNLFVINHPDADGLACDLDTLSVFLNNQCLPYFNGLPNMPNYSLGPLVGSECDTLLAVKNIIHDGIKIYPNPGPGYIVISSSSGISYDMELYNLLGEKVFNRSKIFDNSKIDLPINNGIYELVVKHDDIIVHEEKLIIAK